MLSEAVWFASGWAAGLISGGVVYLVARHLYKRLYVWPHYPVYRDPAEPNL